MPGVAEYAGTLPNVIHSEHNLYSCAEDGLAAMKSAIKEYNLNRAVIAKNKGVTDRWGLGDHDQRNYL